MHAGVGSSQRIFSASFDLQDEVQDYDLQAVIYSASLEAGSQFENNVGTSAVTIQKVYYKTRGDFLVARLPVQLVTSLHMGCMPMIVLLS